ncbi:MAG: hypothetical protein LKJ17_05980 [Oscillospiraceae bacterium]|jgi:hypothetical protein|nr:hypothetical protein [Oscillospiraceae bacterium]
MLLLNRRVESLAEKQKKIERELAASLRNQSVPEQQDQLRDYLNKWDKITLDDKRVVAGCLIEVIYATSSHVDIDWKI